MTYNFTISQRAPWRSVWGSPVFGQREPRSDPRRHAFGSGSDPARRLLQARSDHGPGGEHISAQASTATIIIPYHNYTGEFNCSRHGGYSNYNAFITTWQKQTGRTTFTANYTFSKVLGTRDGQTTNGNQAGAAEYPYSLGSNYGVLAYDHTQIFNAAYVVNLPSPMHGNQSWKAR